MREISTRHKLPIGPSLGRQVFHLTRQLIIIMVVILWCHFPSNIGAGHKWPVTKSRSLKQPLAASSKPPQLPSTEGRTSNRWFEFYRLGSSGPSLSRVARGANVAGPSLLSAGLGSHLLAGEQPQIWGQTHESSI